MSQRSHIAISGSTAICPCSSACSEPSRSSAGNGSAAISSSSSYQSARVGELGGRQVERLEVDHRVVLQALALVAEDRLRVDDRAERERHAVGLALLVQPLDVGHALALGLGEVVAVERLEQRAAGGEVELEHLVGAPQVQVDRALVDGRVGARRLDRAEDLARARVDQDEAVGRRRAQRDPGGRVVVGAARDEAGGALAQQPGFGELLRLGRAIARRRTRRRPRSAAPRGRRRAGARRGSPGWPGR